jgi:ParB/RepB/Spo0J family partition protein
MTDFKLVPLKEIKPDPNQPRKFHDAAANQELTDSVKEKGILQPILIRPNGKGFLVVCGERRFNAATAVQVLFKDRDTIPAVIREMSDDEALQLQLIENLQRKDVHPMEEAVAFKSLLENKTKKLSIEEIAAKVGKTVYFIRQRLKLNALSKGWQDVFYLGKLHVSVALEISVLAPKEQELLYGAKVNKKHLGDPNWEPSISDYDLKQLRRSLKAAPFDTKDETLQPMMGACTKCPFNSAVNSLFPEDEKDPICNNASCYNAKCAKAFEKQLKVYVDDPAVVLIYNYMNNTEDRQLLDKLRKEGHQVHEVNGTYVTSENWQYKGLKGVPIKGFYIGGHEKGRTIMVKIKSAASSNQAKSKQKEGTLTKEDIDTEISRIQDRQKRNRQLDVNSIHKNTLIEVKKNKSKILSLPWQAKADRAIMVYFLIHEISGVNGYGENKISGIKGLPSAPGGFGFHQEYIESLSKVTDNQLAQIIRLHAMSKWGNPDVSREVDKDDAILRWIAAYAGIDIKKIEAAQKEKADAREGRAKSRIESLKKQKSKPVVKKPAKKTAKKK